MEPITRNIEISEYNKAYKFIPEDLRNRQNSHLWNNLGILSITSSVDPSDLLLEYRIDGYTTIISLYQYRSKVVKQDGKYELVFDDEHFYLNFIARGDANFLVKNLNVIHDNNPGIICEIHLIIHSTLG